jgi:hypothetical protein
MPGAVVAWLVTSYGCPSSPFRLPLTACCGLSQEVPRRTTHFVQDNDSVPVEVCAVCSDQSDSHRYWSDTDLQELGAAVTSYQPMTLAELGGRLAGVEAAKTRWKLVWEFLEEYRWEPDNVRPSLLHDEPPATGDERWDVLLAALAEYLAAEDDRAAPEWTEIRVLQRSWFPAELKIQRADALVWAPAAFRKHGVYLSARDLEAA